MNGKKGNLNANYLEDTNPEFALNLDALNPGQYDGINELPIPIEAHRIRITQNTVICVDPETGTILGPKAEGTLGIILYGERADSYGLKNAHAIRIPRLLCSDTLLNFHIAEISNCEGIQAEQFAPDPGLLGSLCFLRLNVPNQFTQIPDHDGGAFLGFYLSPSYQYKACLLSKDHAWPQEFADYLTKIETTPDKLFKDIENHTRTTPGYNRQNLDNLIFLPHRVNDVKDEKLPGEPQHILCLSRKKIHLTHKSRNASGWWFNLPVAVYSWMTMDLQRLLTAGVNDGDGAKGISGEIKALKNWELRHWFEMFKTLAVGFYLLHSRGAIHGDPRPANVMFNAPNGGGILPDCFRWIDIGLGYDIIDIAADDRGQTSITPRPLGGSRTTPFYAPERIEGHEFEDADHIKLVKQNNELILTFYFKHKTDQKLNILRLKEGNKALRELGRLHKGDRVQVREFVFVVEKVRDFDIVVSTIYEIVLDRVLIDKLIDEDSDKIILETLKNASISRYRVFKQWSQASDIYGLGITALYTIFMKGLFKNDLPPNSPGEKVNENGNGNESKTIECPPLDAIFMELVQTLRSKTFLVQFLETLAENDFVEIDSIMKKEILDAEWIESDNGNTGNANDLSKKISVIARQIKAFDYNFNCILNGLDGNIGLFVQFICFCLSCVWREDEWEAVKASNTYGTTAIFQPFCKDRLKIQGTDNPGLPSEKAKKIIEKLIYNIANMSEGYKYSPIDTKFNQPPSKEEQVLKLMNENADLKKRLEQLTEIFKEKPSMQNQFNEKEEENLRLRKKIAAIEREKAHCEGVRQNQEKLINAIEREARRYFEERQIAVILPLLKKKDNKAECYLQEILNLINRDARHTNFKEV